MLGGFIRAESEMFRLLGTCFIPNGRKSFSHDRDNRLYPRLARNFSATSGLALPLFRQKLFCMTGANAFIPVWQEIFRPFRALLYPYLDKNFFA